MLNEKCIEIANKSVILSTVKVKNKTFNQLYVVDLNSPVLIGGTNKPGYDLNFYLTNEKSNNCITEYDLLKVLHCDIVVQNEFETFQLIKR